MSTSPRFGASDDTKDPPGAVPGAEGPTHPVPPAEGQTGSMPGLPASVTKDAAVVTGAPGVVTAETVR